MPCYDSRSAGGDDCSGHIDRANQATRAACEMAAVLRRGGTFAETSNETKLWVARHDRLDEKRAKEAAESAQRQELQKKALDKLTPEERRLLGLDKF